MSVFDFFVGGCACLDVWVGDLFSTWANDVFGDDGEEVHAQASSDSYDKKLARHGMLWYGWYGIEEG